MTKPLGLGVLAAIAVAAPLLAVLALLGLGSNAIACTTVASTTIATGAAVPPAARLWIALAHQACPTLPEPWIAAVMNADSGFDPTHTTATGRGVITLRDADWQATTGTPASVERNRDGVPDISDPTLEPGIAATLLCRQYRDLDARRAAEPGSLVTIRLTALDELALLHMGGPTAVDAYPSVPAASAYVVSVHVHAAAWAAPVDAAASGSPTPSATTDPACVASLGSVGSVVVPPGTPRGTADAIRAALALVGTRSGFTNRCDHLACLAYGYGNSGYDTAADHWRTLLATGHAHPGDHCPPAGAFMFWATRGPEGHVSLVVQSDPGCDPAKIELVSNDVLNSQTGFTGGVYLVTLARIESGFVSRAGYLGWTDPVCAGSKLPAAA